MTTPLSQILATPLQPPPPPPLEFCRVWRACKCAMISIVLFHRSPQSYMKMCSKMCEVLQFFKNLPNAT